jgi:glycosyltransferase involved in cell wall biosynthesis
MRRLAVVSRSLGERYCRYNNISTDTLRVIPYGVPIADVTPRPAADARRELGFAPDDVLVGSVGRLVEQKDYPLQLRGFALAAAQEPRLRMVLVGDGPLRATLEELAVELGVAARVTFAGRRADVPRIVPALDIFVMTPKFEPYGIALLEAKAAGRPIVATAVNEIPEILSFGACGLLVPPGAPDRLAQALLSLARDDGLRAELARRAFEEARERHSLRAMLEGYQGLYDEVRRL